MGKVRFDVDHRGVVSCAARCKFYVSPSKTSGGGVNAPFEIFRISF